MSAIEPVPASRRTPRAAAGVALALVAAILGGCGNGRQIHSTPQQHVISLRPGDLAAHGVAIITPSTVTGQEEDRQTLAFTFAEVLKEERRDVHCVTLAETLGTINRAGLVHAYKLMYDEYQNTGIFRPEILRQVGDVVRTRFLVQLKLATFRQGTQERWSLLGLRILDTQSAHIRLFLQVWDSADGAIAWEGIEELNYSFETTRERSAPFREVVGETARRLIARLP
jgi:hypothetical protein